MDARTLYGGGNIVLAALNMGWVGTILLVVLVVAAILWFVRRA